MKIKGNDIHLTQRELLTAVLLYIDMLDSGNEATAGLKVDDVYGIAAPVRIEGERHDYIVSIKEKSSEPEVA